LTSIDLRFKDRVTSIQQDRVAYSIFLGVCTLAKEEGQSRINLELDPNKD
jgi:hypothetical protein